MVSRIAVALLLGLSLAACSFGAQPSAKKGVTIQATTYLGSIGQVRCSPGATLNAGTAGTGFDTPKGSLWMLVFGPPPPSPPLTAGQDIKIVWRMTGTGDFTVRAADTDGIESKLIFGPTSHGSSSWDGVHPGAEVGTGFNFPHAGCWNIHVTRANTSGDAWLTVA
jgi:hypothetical protein